MQTCRPPPYSPGRPGQRWHQLKFQVSSHRYNSIVAGAKRCKTQAVGLEVINAAGQSHTSGQSVTRCAQSEYSQGWARTRREFATPLLANREGVFLFQWWYLAVRDDIDANACTNTNS